MTRLHQLCGPDLYARVTVAAERDGVPAAEWSRRVLYRACEDGELARAEDRTDAMLSRMMRRFYGERQEAAEWTVPASVWTPLLVTIERPRDTTTDPTPLAQSLAAMRGRLTLDRVHGGGR